MKPTAIRVNTSRGPIDEAAFIDLLERKAGAGLDVFGTEPLPLDHPLRRLKNTVITPHLGYVCVGRELQNVFQQLRRRCPGLSGWKSDKRDFGLRTHSAVYRLTRRRTI